MAQIKTILILLFAFTCSINFAQTNSKAAKHIAGDLKILSNESINNQSLLFPDSVSYHGYSVLNLTGQAVVGSALSVAFTLIPVTVVLGNALSGRPSGLLEAISVPIIISSYILGAAVGVYWVGKAQNSKLSFWGTVGYSAIGGCASAAIFGILATQYKTIPTTGGVIAFLTPVISSMIYASFISDWPEEPQQKSFAKNSWSQKDFFDQSKLFNIELFRVRL